MVLNERKGYLVQLDVHRTYLILFFFFIEIVPVSVWNLVNYDVLLLIVKLNSDFRVDCSPHASQWDIKGLSMQEIQVVWTNCDVFLLVRVLVSDSYGDHMLLLKAFINEREFLTLGQSNIVELYKHSWARHFVFNLVGNGFFRQLGDLVKYIFWHLLNEDLIVLVILARFVLQLKINRSQLVDINGDASRRILRPENHTSRMFGILRKCKVKIFLFICCNSENFSRAPFFPKLEVFSCVVDNDCSWMNRDHLWINLDVFEHFFYRYIHTYCSKKVDLTAIIFSLDNDSSVLCHTYTT